MAVPAIALPFARAIFISLESATKDMWEMYTGPFKIMGRLAFFPMTVVVTTGSCSIRGGGLSCPPRIRISSHPGIGIRVPIASITDFPVTAIA